MGNSHGDTWSKALSTPPDDWSPRTQQLVKTWCSEAWPVMRKVSKSTALSFVFGLTNIYVGRGLTIIRLNVGPHNHMSQCAEQGRNQRQFLGLGISEGEVSMDLGRFSMHFRLLQLEQIRFWVLNPGNPIITSMVWNEDSHVLIVALQSHAFMCGLIITCLNAWPCNHMSYVWPDNQMP